MPNHFHFFIKIKEEAELLKYQRKNEPINEVQLTNTISRCFLNLFNTYSKGINKAYGRTGSLFQERFRREHIDNDNYFTEIIFYIHGNGQHHGLNKYFRLDKYSSYRSILSDKPTMLE